MQIDAEATAKANDEEQARAHQVASADSVLATAARGFVACLEFCIAVALAVTLGALATHPEWLHLTAAVALLLPVSLILAAWTIRR